MWKWEAYLVWTEERLSTTQTVGEGEEVDDSDSDSECIATMTSSNNALSLPSPMLYTFANTAPFHQITIEQIIFGFGATHFLEALSTFLRKHILTCNISPHILMSINKSTFVYLTITI